MNPVNGTLPNMVNRDRQEVFLDREKQGKEKEIHVFGIRNIWLLRDKAFLLMSILGSEEGEKRREILF